MLARLREDGAASEGEEDGFSWGEVRKAFGLPQVWFLGVIFFFDGEWWFFGWVGFFGLMRCGVGTILYALA